MKGKLVIIFVVTCFLISTGVFAQDFSRLFEIPFPESATNTGGVGNMISGMDFDGDGKTDLFLVSHNWNDIPNEMTPSLYKLENTGASWEVVWQAKLSFIEKSNSWPALASADLDQDGKMEIVFGPVNWTTATQPNPPRVVVFESVGDGTDNLGIAQGDTNFAPNAMWTITQDNDVNCRPIRWVVEDIDSDGVDEVIFADRKGNDGGYHFGAFSVSDIPDNGDGSETWTMEVSALDFADDTADNKWDVAVIGSNFYTFDEGEISKVSWDGSAWNYSSLSPLPGGISFITAQSVDLDNDGTKEIIVSEGPYGGSSRSLWLLQEEADTLKRTQLADLSGYVSGGYVMGGAHGDIDQDGNLDFVFGTRDSEPNAIIFRLAYRGGDITDPANYELSIIDSEYTEGGRWGVICVENIDSDPELEVLYASCTSVGAFPNLSTNPVIVLDYIAPTALEFDNLVIAPEVLLNGETPSGLLFKPGRILDNGNTIWFCGVDGTNRVTYVFRSNDGGATFTHNAEAISGRAAQMDAFDENIALVSTAAGKIFKTEDGGATWTEKYSYMINPLGGGWFDGLRILNENVAVAFGDMEPNGNMHFVRTEDKGDTWTEIAGIDYLNAAYGYYTWGLAACNVGQTIWCSATTMEYDSSFVFRSYDAGVTWESFRIPTDVIPNYPRSIAFVDDNNGMIAARGGYVIKSTDGGATWSATNNPDTSASSYVNGVVAIPNTNIIVAMDDIGVYYTTDLGETWGEMNTPPETETDYIVSGVFLNKDFGYVFTDNGLVLRFENQVTGISKHYVDNIPADFQLSQNYPNPFNPTTTIAFDLSHHGKVLLKVYDIMGRKVVTLVNETLEAGQHEVKFDGTQLASGIYFYRLEFDGQIKNRQMVLVK